MKNFFKFLLVIILVIFVSSCSGVKSNNKQDNSTIPVQKAASSDDKEIKNKSFSLNFKEFIKAFQEVSYAYYMRGPYLHYNVSKGKGRLLSPEQSTEQDYNYVACALYAMNVYKELLGLDLSCSDGAYINYARKYIGNRKEVIGYGELQENGDLYWYDGTKDNHQKLNYKINPSQKYIISQLKAGDIIGYKGHIMLIYDVITDKDGNVADAYLIHSTSSGGGSYYTKSKNHFLSAFIYDQDRKKVPLTIGHGPWSSLYYNYRDRRGKYAESGIEGTVTLEKFTEKANKDGILLFDKKKPRNNYKKYYSIIRFVDADANGKAVVSFDGKYREFRGETLNNQEAKCAASVISRLKFSKLFIKKTVDKKDNNVVEPNDELTYKIVIKNKSRKNYTEDLIVKETLSKLVSYKTNRVKYQAHGKNAESKAAFKNDAGTLTWNLGKLNSGDEVIIEYTVKVKENSEGRVIASMGKAADIPSGTVKNKVGHNLTAAQQKAIKGKYESLKTKYNGKALVNAIYKEACNIDLGLDRLNIKANSKEDEAGLVYFNQKWGGGGWNEETYMSVSRKNAFSKMVLNSYFNALYESPLKLTSFNGIQVRLYALPSIGLEENDPDKRANTVFPSDFRTGDILLYINSNDKIYSVIKGTYNTKAKDVTYEDGEYCFIFIEGKGFVGVNLGNDGIPGTKDDRNEFSPQYYKNNNLTYYSKIGTPIEIDTEREEWLQYQTLFGKDYYVILRPSLR